MSMFILFQMSPGSGPAAPGAPVAGGWAGLARARWCGGHLLPAQSVPDPCRVVTTGLSMAFHGPSYGLSRECAMKVRTFNIILHSINYCIGLKTLQFKEITKENWKIYPGFYYTNFVPS